MTHGTQPAQTRSVDFRDRVFDVADEPVRTEQAGRSEVFPMHYHPCDTTLVVVRGLATVVMDGIPHRVTAGQQLRIPAERFHSVYFGRHGCTYRLRRPCGPNGTARKGVDRYV